MKTIEEHRNIIKEIADYAFHYGAQTVGDDAIKKILSGSGNPDVKKLFYIKCHVGFKLAQDKIIEEIKYYQSLYRTKTSALKEVRRKRDKESEKSVGVELKVIKQRLHTLSHMADGIAWQLLGGQLHIARRLKTDEDSPKFLNSSNIKHAKDVADQINQNPMHFALISDLTSYIHIGDLLVTQDHKLLIVELKEGETNEMVSDYLHEINHAGEQLNEDVLKATFDAATVKQIKRVQRQILRGALATEIMQTDQGIDPTTGSEIKIGTPTIATRFYHQELTRLQEELKQNIWSYSVVEACLHVGMYRDHAVLGAGFIIRELLKKQTDNFILVDWLSITDSLSEPIFAKPFPPEFMVDVLTGKVKIIMGLNLDILIDIFNSLGLKARWLTVKETNKSKQFISQKGMVVVNKRGIGLAFPGEPESIMMDGMISKIIFDNIKPSSLVLSYLSVGEPDRRGLAP